jgi:hypothetical protein
MPQRKAAFVLDTEWRLTKASLKQEQKTLTTDISTKHFCIKIKVQRTNGSNHFSSKVALQDFPKKEFFNFIFHHVLQGRSTDNPQFRGPRDICGRKGNKQW